jgi:hypothetical protein
VFIGGTVWCPFKPLKFLKMTVTIPQGTILYHGSPVKGIKNKIQVGYSGTTGVGLYTTQDLENAKKYALSRAAELAILGINRSEKRIPQESVRPTVYGFRTRRDLELLDLVGNHDNNYESINRYNSETPKTNKDSLWEVIKDRGRLGINAMLLTAFAQGKGLAGVYVHELGESTKFTPHIEEDDTHVIFRQSNLERISEESFEFSKIFKEHFGKFMWVENDIMDIDYYLAEMGYC